MLFKIGLFAAILVSNFAWFHSVDADQNSCCIYGVGVSETSPQRAMIVDFNNEKIFYSKLFLSPNERHEAFFDLDTKKYIITTIKASRFLEVFVADQSAEKLQDPIFTTQSKGRYSHSRTAWSQSAKTLCLTGRYHGQFNGHRNLTLTCLKIISSKITTKTFNLNEKMYAHTGIWAINNKLLIAGRKTKEADDKGEDPDIYLCINLNNFSVKEDPTFAQKNLTIMGQINNNSLALTDFTYIYSFYGGSLKKVGEYREGLGSIFGTAADGNSYFSEISVIKEKDGFQYEQKVLASIPWSGEEKYRVLFNGKILGDYNDIIYSNTLLK
jgi:hypothetical protein